MTLRRAAIAVNVTAAIGCFIAAGLGVGSLPRLTWALVGTVCVNVVLFMGAERADERKGGGYE